MIFPSFDQQILLHFALFLYVNAGGLGKTKKLTMSYQRTRRAAVQRLSYRCVGLWITSEPSVLKRREYL
jgi:hypothetical protein